MKKIWTLLIPITTWMDDVAKDIESSIRNWTSNVRTRRKIARMKNSGRNIYSHIHKITLELGIMALTAVAMQANGTKPKYLETVVTFDTNSAPIDVNNRCTGCI